MNIQQLDSVPVETSHPTSWFVQGYKTVSMRATHGFGPRPGDPYSISEPYAVSFHDSVDIYDAMSEIAACKGWRFLNWFEALCFDRRFPRLQFRGPLITPWLAFGPSYDLFWGEGGEPREAWGRVLSSPVDFERLPLPPEAMFLVAASTDVDRDSLGSAIETGPFSALYCPPKLAYDSD